MPGRLADELSPAQVDPADAGFRFCRPGDYPESLPASDRREVSILQLWRLHADSVGVAPDMESGMKHGHGETRDNTGQDLVTSTPST